MNKICKSHTCLKAGIPQPLEDFPIRRSGLTEYRGSKCRVCLATSQRGYRDKHKAINKAGGDRSDRSKAKTLQFQKDEAELHKTMNKIW